MKAIKNRNHVIVKDENYCFRILKEDKLVKIVHLRLKNRRGCAAKMEDKNKEHLLDS